MCSRSGHPVRTCPASRASHPLPVGTKTERLMSNIRREAGSLKICQSNSYSSHNKTTRSKLLTCKLLVRKLDKNSFQQCVQYGSIARDREHNCNNNNSSNNSKSNNTLNPQHKQVKHAWLMYPWPLLEFALVFGRMGQSTLYHWHSRPGIRATPGWLKSPSPWKKSWQAKPSLWLPSRAKVITSVRLLLAVSPNVKTWSMLSVQRTSHS